MTRSPQAGLTLVEVVLGALTLAIVVAAILGAYIGQLTLNEHGRNVSLASNDASRILEQIRREQAAGCAQPEAVPPPPAVDWDGWMSTESIALNPATGWDNTGNQRTVTIQTVQAQVRHPDPDNPT